MGIREKTCCLSPVRRQNSMYIICRISSGSAEKNAEGSCASAVAAKASRLGHPLRGYSLCPALGASRGATSS